MAITGRFLADFSSFSAAVKNAEVELRGMETSASKVSGSLNRMVDQFSGRQIVSEATLVTAAVERIGGASKLTAAEQDRVNRTVTEALQKYAALGQQAPANMQALAEATKRVESPTEGLSAKMVALGTAIGTMAANAAIALTKLAVEGVKNLAGYLVDLAVTGAGLGDVSDNFQRMTEQSGLLSQTLLGTLRAGLHSTVSDLDLMKLVNQDLAAGMRLTDAQFGTLAKGAFSLAQATGGDVKEALDTMNDAMLTGRTRTLALLTGKIDLEAAELKYAESLGILRKDLTDTQKLEAARAAILDSVTAATARLGEQTDGLDERVAQAKTGWANFEAQLSITLGTSPKLMAAIDAVGDSLKSAFGGNQHQLILTITAGIFRFADFLINSGLVLVEWGKTGARVFASIDVVIRVVTGAMLALVERFSAGIATMAELAAKLPGVGGAFDGVAASARRAADTWAAVREENNRMLDASKAQASGQGELNGVLNQVEGVLLRVKTAMAGAALVAKDHKEKTEAQVLAIGAATEATKRQETALVATAIAQKKFNADLDEFEEKAKVLPPFTGLLTDVERKVGELASGTEVLRSNLRFTADVVASEMSPAMDQLRQKTEAATRATLSWSEAMELARTGQGTLGGAVGSRGGTPFSTEERIRMEQMFREGRYQGPIKNYTTDPWGKVVGGEIDWDRLNQMHGINPVTPIRATSAASTSSMTVVNQITQPLGTPSAIAAAVNDAMTQWLRSSVIRLPSGA